MEQKSKHYVFHYEENSVAGRDINKIVSLQEECYSFISICLGTESEGAIHYHLYDTPEEVGRQYAIIYDDDEEEPCNGFALPNTKSNDGLNHIYAVYSNNVKCIGLHEDAHVISYSYGRPTSKFVREGLAMFFDRYWWGIDNYSWTLWYIQEHGGLPAIKELLQNDCFDEYDEIITYPLSGAFTSYLMERYGNSRYKDFFKASVSDVYSAFENVFGDTLETIEDGFLCHVKMFRLRPEVRELMIKDSRKE